MAYTRTEHSIHAEVEIVELHYDVFETHIKFKGFPSEEDARNFVDYLMEMIRKNSLEFKQVLEAKNEQVRRDHG